jgi:hypothetical protein
VKKSANSTPISDNVKSNMPWLENLQNQMGALKVQVQKLQENRLSPTPSELQLPSKPSSQDDQNSVASSKASQVSAIPPRVGANRVVSQSEKANNNNQVGNYKRQSYPFSEKGAVIQQKTPSSQGNVGIVVKANPQQQAVARGGVKSVSPKPSFPLGGGMAKQKTPIENKKNVPQKPTPKLVIKKEPGKLSASRLI